MTRAQEIFAQITVGFDNSRARTLDPAKLSTYLAELEAKIGPRCCGGSCNDCSY